MKVLSKYLCKEFLKILLLCEIAFLAIYLIIDFFQKVDNFIDASVSKGVMISYFLFKCPFVIVQMIPPATLISVIILFSLMKKNQEFAALKACGLNVFKLSQPIILVSLFIGACLFFFSEGIVPYTSTRSNEIWNIDVEKREQNRFYGRHQIWYKGPKSILWIKHFNVEAETMENPTFYFFDDAFHILEMISSEKGKWVDGRWKMENGLIQRAKENGSYDLEKFEELNVDIPETPETFVRSERAPEEMSYWQLKRYAKRVRMEGYDNTRYLVDMNIKTSFPFVVVILVVIGISLALRLKGGRVPLTVAIGIGLCFLYNLALGFSRSLGLSGIMPPILSAWMANAIFLFFGIYLMMHVES